MPKKIVWLSSYPKSGNTWIRILLSNLIYNPTGVTDINDISVNRMSYSRKLFDEMIGLDTSLFNEKEEDDLRADAFISWGKNLKETVYIKAHELYYYDSKNRPVFPASVSSSVIYIVRNPLDVAVSFSNHLKTSIDKVIEHMNDINFNMTKMTGNNFQPMLSQRLSSWSQNVLSWIDQDEIPVHIVKYEDLIKDDFSTFERLLSFLNLSYNKEEIKSAIDKSRFKNLQKNESEKGFREQTSKEVSFFWKGESGNWKKYLSSLQKDRILKEHGEVMNRLNYLDEKGNPIY